MNLFTAPERRGPGQRNYAFSVVANGTEQLMPEGSFPTEAPFKILSSKAEWHGPALTLFQGDKFLTRAPLANADGNLLRSRSTAEVLTRITHLSLPMGRVRYQGAFRQTVRPLASGLGSYLAGMLNAMWLFGDRFRRCLAEKRAAGAKARIFVGPVRPGSKRLRKTVFLGKPGICPGRRMQCNHRWL